MKKCGLFALLLATAACQPGTSVIPDGGSGTGGGSIAKPTGTARINVNLKTGEATIENLGPPESRTAFAGSAFTFKTAKLLDIDSELSVRRMALSWKNNSGLTLGSRGKVRFVISDVAAVSTGADLSSFVNVDRPIQTTTPEDLWVDSDGTVFGVSASTGQLVRSTGGSVQTLLSGIFAPRGVVGDANFVYVAIGHRILRLNKDGTNVTTLAGSTTAGSADGSGASARFNNPGAMTFGPDGALYVCDQTNGSIRRVALDGTVTTVATGAASPSDIAVFTANGKPYFAVASFARNKILGIDPATGEMFEMIGTGLGTYSPANGDTSSIGQVYGLAAIDGSLYFSLRGGRVIGQATLAPGALPKDRSAWGLGSLVNHSGVPGNSPIGEPRGLFADAAGTIWFADQSAGFFGRVRGSSRVLPIPGPGGTGPAAGDIALVGADEKPREGAYTFHGPGTIAPGAEGEISPLSFVVQQGIDAFSFTVTVEAATEESIGLPGGFDVGSPDVLVQTIGGKFFGRFEAYEDFRDGIGSEARFGELSGVDADDWGHAYLTDTRGKRVIRYDGMTGRFSTIINPTFGTNTTGVYNQTGENQTLAGPRGVKCSADGKTLYFIDVNNIVRADYVGEDPSGFDDPSNWQVKHVAGALESGDATGSGGDARFSSPWGLALDPQLRATGKVGSVFVADRNNHRIKRVSGSQVANFFGTGAFGNGTDQLSFPGDVLFGPQGQMYVAEQGAARVSIIDTTQKRRLFHGEFGAHRDTNDSSTLQATFELPLSLATDGAAIYLADFLTLRRLNSSSTRTLFGDVLGSGIADGPGDQARFNPRLSQRIKIAFLSPDVMIMSDDVTVRKISRIVR